MLLVDGSPQGSAAGLASVGAVICTPHGRMLAWHAAEVAARTSMEAEYQAVIAGLELAQRRYQGAAVRCLSDCQIVIEQLNGRYAVRAAGLKPLHARATQLARQIGRVEFRTIPRELNELADALAGFRAAHGRMTGWLRRSDETQDKEM